jgi:hypothetical protein
MIINYYYHQLMLSFNPLKIMSANGVGGFQKKNKTEKNTVESA